MNELQHTCVCVRYAFHTLIYHIYNIYEQEFKKKQTYTSNKNIIITIINNNNDNK